MKKIGQFLALLFTSFVVLGPLLAQDHAIDDSKKPRFLYALSAQTGTLKDGTLTLNEIPTVVYFSDRPYRVAGQTSLKKFVDEWEKGAESFQDNPPNAVLSIFNHETPRNIVVVLKDPVLTKNTLTFKVTPYDKQKEDTFNQVSLFIDAAPALVNGQITD